MIEPIRREAARVAVIDDELRILLLHTRDPARAGAEWWELPGGGIETGESVQNAARRELFEETGIKVENIGPCLEHVQGEFLFRGKRYRQMEALFAVQLQECPPPHRHTLSAIEGEAHLGYGWWHLNDALEAGLRLYPKELPEIVPPFANRFAKLS